MRKSRASHVKCDCGEKTHKCTHLQATVEGHRETCCCNHGGRCTCSHKKELPALDTVPESDSDVEASTKSSAAAKGPNRNRRRANTIHSDGMLTFDENGHHKPVHKHSRASQKCGPYQLNRGNSLHSAGSNRSMDNLQSEASQDGCCGSSTQRKVKSEAASPLLRGGTFGSLGQLPPLDLSGIDYPSYRNGGFDSFGDDAGLFSAGLSATSVDWSHYDLDFNTNKLAENFAPSSYSQGQSYGGFDFNGSEQAPTLTTTTSGEVSEVEELFGTGVDDFDGTGVFGGPSMSTASSSFNLAAQCNELDGLGADLSNSAFDLEELNSMKAASKRFLPQSAAPAPASLSGDDAGLGLGSSAYPFVDDALWMSQYGQGVSDSDPNQLFWQEQ